MVGWTDPEARRSHFGAPLLAYYDPGGRLIYAGRVGTGIDNVELERLWRRLQPLTTYKMPLDVPPPRGARFGSPLVLSRVHWVQELVAEASSSSPGPRTICCAKSSTRGCGRTSPRERCGARWTAKSKFAGGAWRRNGPRPRLKYSVDHSHPANSSTICRMPLTINLYSLKTRRSSLIFCSASRSRLVLGNAEAVILQGGRCGAPGLGPSVPREIGYGFGGFGPFSVAFGSPVGRDLSPKGTHPLAIRN